MSTVPVTVAPGDPISVCAARMREHQIGLLPVVEAGAVVGVVTDRDLVVRGLALGLPPTTPTSEVMSRSVVSCKPDEELAAVSARWAEERRFRVLVEEEGRLVGVLSLADVGRVEEPARFGALARAVLLRDAAPPPSLR